MFHTGPRGSAFLPLVAGECVGSSDPPVRIPERGPAELTSNGSPDPLVPF